VSTELLMQKEDMYLTEVYRHALLTLVVSKVIAVLHVTRHTTPKRVCINPSRAPGFIPVFNRVRVAFLGCAVSFVCLLSVSRVTIVVVLCLV
jgi:hypothetical protein